MDVLADVLSIARVGVTLVAQADKAGAAQKARMFIILLRFSSNKSKAGELMAAHNHWITRGLEDSVFVLVGSLQPSAGGAILVHGLSRSDLEARVSDRQLALTPGAQARREAHRQ